jgi:hypothetical protein
MTRNGVTRVLSILSLVAAAAVPRRHRRPRPAKPPPTREASPPAPTSSGSCSLIRLVALPEEGVVISVQANTAATEHPYDAYNGQVVRLTQLLRDAARW